MSIQHRLFHTSGTDFEKEIASTFGAYAEAGVAMLAQLPVPMAPTNHRSHQGSPLYIPKGKAPFDVYGWWMADGRFVAAELKLTVRKDRLPIVGPNAKGSGLQAHQISALADAAKCGCIVRIVWNNGGEVGVLDNERIINAYDAAEQAWAGRSDAGRGSKSIAWERFHPIDYAVIGGQPALPWLLHDRVS